MRRWRTALSVVSAATLLAAGSILWALPEQRVNRVASEKTEAGLTIAERVEGQRRLHGELMSRIPAGVDNEPVYVDITQKDRDDLAVRPASGSAPLRVGVVKPLLVTAGKRGGRNFDRGILEEQPDGSFVWAVKVVSPDAQAIRLHITGFSLPENTEMYFIGVNEQAHGPYVGRGRNNNGDFWTRAVVSDNGTILVRYTGENPRAARQHMTFSISEVAHIRGRPPKPQERNHDDWPCSDNATCLVDAQCGSTGPATPAEDAVAKMEWIQGPFVNTCTGGLLADTDTGTQIPYFLTANHCLTSSNSSLETFFNYITDSCNGGCPDGLVAGGTPPAASTVGVTVVATGSAGDFTLLTLDEAPPAGATFLGWNNSPIANSNGANLYRISNANFGPQVYSEHDVDTGSPECTGWPRGERIYSVDQTGATMGGSSGSPVVNSAGEVVGQLSGCCGFNCQDECDSANNWTVDGALAFYWDSVAQFLDPQGGGGSCDNDGACEAGEDCGNCPDDCRSKTNGKPSTQYCCDGDQPQCGDARCSLDGWVCGGGGGTCTPSSCDDGLFCNGQETCSGDTCQSGSSPCSGGQTCDEAADQCVGGSCGGNKASCSSNSDCCSGVCGRNGKCRGN